MEQLIAVVVAGFTRIMAAITGRRLGTDRDIRFQVIDITVAAGSVAGTPVEDSVMLDRAYNRITGIAFFESSNGGIANNYNVGARSTRKTWIDLINVKAWNADEGVSPDDKYYDTDIPYASGDSFYVRVSPNAVPATDLNGQMVLRLEKSLTELPK